MSLSKVAQLQGLIQGLKEEKKTHLRAIQEIDKAFAGLGLSVDVGAVGAAKVVQSKGLKKAVSVQQPVVKEVKAGKPAKQNKFKVTGAQFIINTVNAAGNNGLSSSDIVEKWGKSGRGKSVYNVLGDLVKKGLLKKHAAKKGEASTYTVA
jgi:hypothetical protein